MSNQWCAVCNKTVDAVTSRGVGMAVAPLASMAVAALPRLFRRRFGLLGITLNGAASIAAGYLANRYLAPHLRRVVCGSCGNAVASAA